MTNIAAAMPRPNVTWPPMTEPSSVPTAPETATMTGLYFEKNQPVKPSRAARDEAAAKRLWEISETLTGLA